MKKGKMKQIIIVASIIIVIAIIAVIVGTMKDNKNTEIQEKTEKYNIELTNKFAENENIKISIDNVAYADQYLILEYTVKARNENESFFIENYAEKNKFGFYLDRNIKIDGKLAKTNDDYSNQISYKISDIEAKIYDVIEVKNLPDKFNLEVKFFENDNTIVEDDEEITEEIIEEDEEQDDEADEELVEDMDPDEYYNSSEERESVLTDEEYEEFEDEYTEEFEEDEEDLEEEYEEVEGYYDGIEEAEEETEDDTETMTEELGTIITKANKEELIKDVTVKDYNEEYETNNISIKSQKIIKTPFKTFIIVDTTITEVHYQDVESKLIGDPYRYKIDVQDNNGNSINVNQIQQITVTDEDETDIDDLEINGDNIPDNLISTIKTIIVLEEGIEEIKLQPYYYSYEFPNDDIETAMQNKEWFKVEDDEYEYIEENANGGEITITEIEEKDNQILFHYTTNGFVPDAESIVLLRNSTKEFNIFYPDILKRKGINSDENIVGYNLENNTSYSYINNFDEDNLENIKDLEFTLLEGLEIEKIGEGFSIEI